VHGTALQGSDADLGKGGWERGGPTCIGEPVIENTHNMKSRLGDTSTHTISLFCLRHGQVKANLRPIQAWALVRKHVI
jgi:hypothetical protein